MTNKRDLKRAINYICSDLATECVAASFSVEESEREYRSTDYDYSGNTQRLRETCFPSGAGYAA